MPGQWVLDDSQSLYYLEHDDVPEKAPTEQLPRRVSRPGDTPFRRPSQEYHIPMRHQHVAPGWDSTITDAAKTRSSFKRPRLSFESDVLQHPFASRAGQDSPLADWDLDNLTTSNDVFSTPASTTTVTTTSATLPGVFGPTPLPALEISRRDRSRHRQRTSTANRLQHRHRTERTPTANHRDECDRSQKEAQQAIMRALARLDRATLFDHTFTHPLSSLSLAMGFNTSLPKSQFDTYIMALRQLLRGSSDRCFLSNELQRAITAEGVLWVVREAWPAAEGYWNLTATFRGFLHAELWRNFPCQRSYNQLPPAYRPTRAQLSVPHSPMIDWMPWPDVRDMAIMYQDQIDVDALFRMAIHNVVAHRKRRGRRKKPSLRTTPYPSSLCRKIDDHDDDSSKTPLLHTPSSPLDPPPPHLSPPSNQLRSEHQTQEATTTTTNDDDDDHDDDVHAKTSFRVWDLVCLEKAHGTNPLAEPGLEKKPVPRSPGLRALLRAYDLEYDEFDTQKLDDGFFEAYPCLYTDTAASAWKVQRFPNMPVEDVGGPVPLSRDAVFRLKARIESMIGAEILI
ncbi:hypothetical protein FOPE_01986 [Fonsecaea pedrosoi]|nr:hypothetical protein FOPE_01986 [Fonsecaea pedrosoi]